MGQPLRTDLSEIIAENFGANATYVEGLLSRFRSNPELVDESWRAYFAELLGDSAASTPQETSGNGGAARSQSGWEAAARARWQRTGWTQMDARTKSAGKCCANAGPATAAAPEAKQSAPAPAKPATEQQVEVIPIRGAALKIVENMEASLSVPTATSQRRIPGKVTRRKPPINQQTSSGERPRQGFVYAPHRVGPASCAR